MRKELLTALVVGGLAVQVCGADDKRAPTVDDLLRIRSIVPPIALSPDGHRVAYSVVTEDPERNSTVVQIWLADAQSGGTSQFTRGERSCTSPQWSPDGQWLTFLSGRVGERDQLFAIRPSGGEALQLTNSETGVGSYAWSRDGKQIAFLASEPPSPAAKERKERLGEFEVFHREYDHTHLWTLDVREAMEQPVAGRQRTRGKDYSVQTFAWSPSGRAIAFSATVNPDATRDDTEDLYTLALEDDTVRKLVSQPGPDSNPKWSPDGTQVAFSSAMRRPDFATANRRVALVPAAGGAPQSLTDRFDESPELVDWNPSGLFFWSLQRTTAHLFRLDPKTESAVRVTTPDGLISWAYSFSSDGRRTAFLAGSADSLPELYVTDLEGFAPRKLTDMTIETKDLILGTREVISWKSKDGVRIEGVLIKPSHFDPEKKYPLLCVIHAGPDGEDFPVLLLGDTYVYPVDVWVARGALVLKVNYRGSVGYGEKFRQLNFRNLGVGDAWDVLSGVDHLVGQGWVDPARIGCMGWSQGGYISAFLTTTSDRFAAVSVGAGISNWQTYYYNTDITPFTVRYLGKNPIEDPEIYRKTSPMTFIGQAKTPTLIQHGENDRRVPIANAYELRQGLEDRKVPVEMIVYKGSQHIIGEPRKKRAAMQHNLAWFNHYLWGDPLPDFTARELPVPAPAKP
jgi:dipeptidyl aminopeptidase/acylaminoacyl peptidase